MNEQAAKMRAFLGKVATEVLSWPRVDSVRVSLESDFAFEGGNWNGVVYVQLWGMLRYGHTFSWVELTHIIDDSLLIERLRQQHDKFIGESKMP